MDFFFGATFVSPIVNGVSRPLFTVISIPCTTAQACSITVEYTNANGDLRRTVITKDAGTDDINAFVINPPPESTGTREPVTAAASQMAGKSLNDHNNAYRQQVQDRLLDNGGGGVAGFSALDLSEDGVLQGDARLHSGDVMRWLAAQRARVRAAKTGAPDGAMGIKSGTPEFAAAEQGAGDAAGILAYAGQQSTGRLTELTPSRPLSLWTAGGISKIDNTDPTASFDAELIHARIGLDHKAGNSLYGVVVGLEWGDADIDLDTTELDSDTVSVAGYFGHRWGSLLLDGSFGWARIDYSEESAIVTGSFDADRWFGTVNLTGVHDTAYTRSLPRLGVEWLTEDQKGYISDQGTAVAGDSFSLGRLVFGGDFYLKDPNNPHIQPFVRAEGEWDFVRPDTVVFSNGAQFKADTFGVVLGGGLKADLGPGSRLHIEATADSIGRSDTESYSGKAEISFSY